MSAKLDRTDTRHMYVTTMQRLNDLRKIKEEIIMSNETRRMIGERIQNLEHAKYYLEDRLSRRML